MWQLKKTIPHDRNAVSLIRKLTSNLNDEEIFEEMHVSERLSIYIDFEEAPVTRIVHMFVRQGK